MNLGKQVNSVRRYAGGGIVSVLILFSPVFAFFVLMPWYTSHDNEKPEPARVVW